VIAGLTVVGAGVGNGDDDNDDDDDVDDDDDDDDAAAPVSCCLLVAAGLSTNDWLISANAAAIRCLCSESADEVLFFEADSWCACGRGVWILAVMRKCLDCDNTLIAEHRLPNAMCPITSPLLDITSNNSGLLKFRLTYK
jgi:hypothetical protein